MSTTLQFDFTVNKTDRTIVINREFDADLETVWEAWTTPHILEQWIAPKPLRAETVSMEFKEGGCWHYAMITPQGEKHWSRYDYQKIEPQKSIIESRAFCDANGDVNPAFARTLCTNIFKESNGITQVTITAQYGSQEVLEYMVTHGFKEGMSSAFQNLDAMLVSLPK